MLVLGRAVGQRLILTLPDGQEIVVEVCNARPKNNGYVVHLGVSAPADVRIDREEIHAKRRWLAGGEPGC